MAGLLYYFAGHQQPVSGVSKIPDVDLRKQLHGCGIEFGTVHVGPEQTAGQIIAVQPQVPQGGGRAAWCGYSPAAGGAHVPGGQTWTPVGGGLWIGWETQDPPRPEDLIRREPVEGHPVRLADGNEWVFPAVHPLRSTLPQRYAWRAGAGGSGNGGNGQPAAGWYTMLAPGYDEICRRSARFMDWWQKSREGVEPEGGPIFEPEACDYVSACLAINYVVGPREVGVLGLLWQTHLLHAIEATLGLPALVAELEAQKKSGTQLAGSAA